MAKTNWQDPKTGEIRSPHISGLQEAVGKIEESIGIETVAENDIPLTEVFISNDDRCRIYQAPEGKRNWLLSPTPIVKKNGNIITDDFEIDYGGGAIVFTTPILETDTLTADATYTVKIEGKQLSTNDYSDEEKEKNQDNKESIKILDTTINQSKYIKTEKTTNSIINTPVESKEAPIKLNIEGNTISNSVYNGDFSKGTDGWVGVLGAIISASDGTLTILGDNKPTPYTRNVINITIQSGKRFFIRGKVMVTNSVCSRVFFGLGSTDTGNLFNGGHELINNPLENKWYDISMIVTVPSGRTGSLICVSQHDYVDGATANGKAMKVKEVTMLDLDQHPQLANLTTEEINELVPSYIEGTQSVDGLKITSIGKNIFNKDNSIQGYEMSTVGAPYANPNYFISNFIEVEQNASYVKNTTNRFYLYDKDKKFISRTEPTLNTLIPNGIRYIRLEALLVELDTFQLERNTIGTDFEPYTETSTFVSEGLYSLPNGVKDALEGNKLTKNINKIDLDEQTNYRINPIGISGYKGVAINIMDSSPKDRLSGRLVKYNGTEIPLELPQSPILPKEIGWISSDLTSIYMTIQNTDSGWGDNYTPTVDEIKAYFMGWKMYNASGGWMSPYNGIGTKGWGEIKPNPAEYGKTTNVVPTTMNSGEYAPYQLYYELATPEVKELDLSTLVSRKDGHIILENWDRYVLKAEDIEAVTYGTNVSIAKTTSFNNVSLTWSMLTIDNDVIIPNKKEIIPTDAKEQIDSFYTHRGTITPTSNVYFILPLSTTLEQAKQLLAGTVIYYKVATKYEITPNWSVKIPTTLKAQVNENNNTLAGASELANRNKDLIEYNEKRLDSLISKNIPWIDATLQNGWSGYVKYRKNKIGQLEISITAVIGTKTSGTVIANLPLNYMPIGHTPITVYTDGKSFKAFFINNNNGNIIIASDSELSNLSGNVWANCILNIKE